MGFTCYIEVYVIQWQGWIQLGGGILRIFSGKGVETSQKSPIGHFVSLYGSSIWDPGGLGCVI